MENYINAKTFKDFCKNQKKLIDILNHNMTKIQVDVAWIKKILWIIFGVVIVSFLSIVIKSGLGI